MFCHFLENHYLAIAAVGWFLFTSAVNAMPPQDSPFVFGTWFRAFLLEIAQHAPTHFPVVAQAKEQPHA